MTNADTLLLRRETIIPRLGLGYSTPAILAETAGVVNHGENSLFQRHC